MMRDDQSGHVARGEFACTCQRNQEVVSFVAFDIVASQLCNGCEVDRFSLPACGRVYEPSPVFMRVSGIGLP